MLSANLLSILCLVIQVINEDVEEDWTQYLSLGYTTSHWPPTRLRAADQHPIDLSIQLLVSVH